MRVSSSLQSLDVDASGFEVRSRAGSTAVGEVRDEGDDHGGGAGVDAERPAEEDGGPLRDAGVDEDCCDDDDGGDGDDDGGDDDDDDDGGEDRARARRGSEVALAAAAAGAQHASTILRVLACCSPLRCPPFVLFFCWLLRRAGSALFARVLLLNNGEISGRVLRASCLSAVRVAGCCLVLHSLAALCRRAKSFVVRRCEGGTSWNRIF